MQKILLHICCGICASSVVQKLNRENFSVVGFFYNPNIHPESEYHHREEIARQVSRILKFELVSGVYDKHTWFQATQGLENEPEGAGRCLACFKLRLEESQKKADQMNISKFATTLTVSPHKNTSIINDIGRAISPSGFLAYDFKKDGGFRLAIEFAKRYNLYRQNYCGCVYSKTGKTKC
ncbi:MAG: epoxyqueuosine reductase QueH [Candidatus Omnitrophota bacterium]|jgi:predicted adenine nucleotide alpha hydrolase (AANH) superfamily ATPase